MSQKLIPQIGDLCGEPREVGHPDQFEVKFILNLNEERDFEQDSEGQEDDAASFLDVVCSGSLAKHILASNWAAGLKIMVLGHLVNNDFYDHDVGVTVPAFKFEAIHAGPSAWCGPVTAVRQRAPRHEPVRAGDMFSQISRALEERQRSRTEVSLETSAAA